MPAEITARGETDTQSHSGGGRQGADRQVDDSFACPHIGAGKTFNRFCVNMLSATAHVARCHLSVRPAPQLRLRHPPLPGVSLFLGIRCHLSVRPAPQLRLRHPPLPGVSLFWRFRCHLASHPAPRLKFQFVSEQHKTRLIQKATNLKNKHFYR